MDKPMESLTQKHLILTHPAIIISLPKHKSTKSMLMFSAHKHMEMSAEMASKFLDLFKPAGGE